MSFLQRLVQYETRMRAKKKGSTPLFYSPKRVRYRIELDGEGQFLAVDALQGDDNDAKKAARGRIANVPDLARSGLKAGLLVDKIEYVCGLPADKKSAEAHEAFKALLREAHEATNLPELEAILKFYDKHDSAALDALLKERLEAHHLKEIFDTPASSPQFGFLVDGVEPESLPEMQQFWQDRYLEEEEGAVKGEDLLTGEMVVPMTTEPIKIKGIMGGQGSGTNFISADKSPFSSYGLQQSTIAPIGLKSAELYRQAFARLIGDKYTHMYIGDLTMLFWTDEGALPVVRTVLSPELTSKDDAEAPTTIKEIRDTIDAAQKGQVVPLPPGTAFHSALLSANGARVVLRSHHSGSPSETLQNLERFVMAQRTSEAHDARSYGLYTLAASAVRDANKEAKVVGIVAADLARFAFFGTPISDSVLAQVVIRNRAERDINRSRAALISLVLNSRKEKNMNEIKPGLDKNRPETAYHLGRLLAVMNHVQKEAIGSKSTLVGTYYGSMSTMPHLVLGRLWELSQHHMHKLRRDSKYASRLDKMLTEVAGAVGDIPQRPLSLQEQALFGLGFHHQMQEIFKKSDNAPAQEQEGEQQ